MLMYYEYVYILNNYTYYDNNLKNFLFSEFNIFHSTIHNSGTLKAIGHFICGFNIDDFNKNECIRFFSSNFNFCDWRIFLT